MGQLGAILLSQKTVVPAAALLAMLGQWNHLLDHLVLWSHFLLEDERILDKNTLHEDETSET